MSDERPVEKIGPSGLSAAQIHKLIQETGLKSRPLFTDREVVRRVIDSLVEQGKLRVVDEVEVDPQSRHCTKENCPETNVPYSANFCPGCGSKILRQ